MKRKPEPSENIMKGDEVYYRRDGKSLQTGTVRSCGADGFVVKSQAGERHRVLHEHYVGHKRRKPLAAKIIEHGEDGTLAEMEDGRHLFLRGMPRESMAKAEPVVLLLKADIKNRPGLLLQGVTDKAGHQTKRWKRSGEERPGAKSRGKGADVGAADVGDHVGWLKDGKKSSGKVVARGKDGVTVEGVGGQREDVKWSDLRGTGHRFAPESHGSSKMSDEDIGKLHTHAGEPTHNTSHRDVTDEDSAYASADVALKDFTRALLRRGGVAQALGAEVFVNDPVKALEHVRENPGVPVLMIAPLKGRVRAAEKAGQEGWENVRDLVRGSLIVPTLDQVPQAMQALKASGIKIARIKNRFAKPVGGYRDILANIEMPNGHIGELQIHVAPMILAKEAYGGHAHYEVQRAISERHEKDNAPLEEHERQALEHAEGAIKNLYDQAWHGARGSI